jgi:hypothetical protein
LQDNLRESQSEILKANTNGYQRRIEKIVQFRKSVNQNLESVTKLYAEAELELEELVKYSKNTQKELRCQAFLNNYAEMKQMLSFKRDQIDNMLADEEEQWEREKKRAPYKRVETLQKIMDYVSNFQVDLEWYSKASLLEVHGARLAKLD